MLSRRRFIHSLVGLMLVLAVFPLTSAHALTDSYAAKPFRFYYQQHEGLRVLGSARSLLLEVDGYPAQYFEKGRIEDHRSETSDPTWTFMYGLLTVELMERAPQLPANSTSTTYGDMRRIGEQRHQLPEGFQGGPTPVAGGVFVPLDAQLGAAPGYIVPEIFWSYINNRRLFPGGWLHDIGLPLTDAFSTQTVKSGEQRTITMQAFERAVLTYDPLNPASWQVERGNIGSDALLVNGGGPPPNGDKRMVVDLSEQWLYAYEGDVLVHDAPVSTGRDGFNTPVGRFSVYLKYKKQTMRGSLNGESWVVPDVPHVMYIYGDVALHGAYWHNLFGTGARLSHGCVNLPLDDAAALWDWAPVGTPVEVRT